MEEILEVFRKSDSPLNALTAMQDFSLPWLVSKLFLNQSGEPLRLMPFQCVLLDMLWTKKFPMLLLSRGGSKSFCLALYALLRAMLSPGSKIIIAGASFRQSKIVFGYVDKFFRQSPIIQEALLSKKGKGPRYQSDTALCEVGNSEIRAIPIGDPEKVRGLRSTHILLDETASVPEETFEHVISPFAAVHANPERRVMVKDFMRRLKDLGASNKLLTHIDESLGIGNQIVLAGTASYYFNHFFKRYTQYKEIIETQGDPEKIRIYLEDNAKENNRVIDNLKEEIIRLQKSWLHYGIFQLPYEGMPEGFLDAEIIANHRVSFSKVRFGMEYQNIFAKDSEGFIRRSEIESATPKDPPLKIELYGDPRALYSLGLDPARWNDNFGAVVCKIQNNKIIPVYCTAWQRKEARVSLRNIRNILKRFNIQYIAIDKGGGGDHIVDLLRLPEMLDNPLTDELLWPIPEQLEEKSDLGRRGRNIIEMVSFIGWVKQAAHSLQADINSGRINFVGTADPDVIADQYVQFYNYKLTSYDVPIEVNSSDKQRFEDELFGHQDDNFITIEEGIWDHYQRMIDETCAIERQVTPGGDESFALPKLSDQPEGLDIRRRDRFSALLLATYGARVLLDKQMRTERHSPQSVGLPGHILKTGKRARKRGNTFYL